MLEFRADPESPYHKPHFKKDETVLVYCTSGGRAALSGKTLRELGYQSSTTPAASRNWRTPGSTPSPPGQRVSAGPSVDDGDRFDLDHRVGIGKAADLDRRAGWRGRSEIAHPHIGVLGELLIVRDVGIGLDDVG